MIKNIMTMIHADFNNYICIYVYIYSCLNNYIVTKFLKRERKNNFKERENNP